MQRIRLALWSALIWLVAACSGYTEPESEPVSQPVPEPLVRPERTQSLREAAAHVNSYMIYYSRLNETIINQAKNYELVIVHPFEGNITAAEIDQIQIGNDPDTADDDVIVMCYISIGEDSRTFGLTDDQLLNDPENRFVSDGSGPSTDPRGPGASGQSLLDLNPVGVPSPGGTGFAPYFLDDNDYDGSPDRNGNFDVAFVNAGHPEWYAVINAMTFHADGVPGLHEMLSDDTTNNQRGLGCDGLFLDTIDTAAPNLFTDSSSVNQSEFEWTAPGFVQFIERVRNDYPEKLILQNRGLFFFNSVFPHYQVSTRSLVDFVFFESYRLDSSTANTFHPYFHPDNKYNFRPRLMAEAQRNDGFRVLSLGYAEGPPSVLHPETLEEPTNPDALGFDILIDDIIESERLSGFRHYLTNEQITLVNDFVRLNSVTADTEAPVWNSTYNVNMPPYPIAASPPDNRIGVQQVVAGDQLGEVKVRWDIALDYNPVKYRLYYQNNPFDFAADPDLTAATQVELQGTPTDTYFNGPSPGAYPNEVTIGGLTENQPYYFIVRARDSVGNEEKNQVVIESLSASTPVQRTITIDGDFTDWDGAYPAYVDAEDATGSIGPDWRALRVANDDTQLAFYAQLANTAALNGNFNIYIDADLNPNTGFASGSLSGLGADFLIQAGDLYSMQTGTDFGTTWLGSISTSASGNFNAIELAVPFAQLGIVNAGQKIGMVFINDAALADYAPEIGQPVVFQLAVP